MDEVAEGETGESFTLLHITQLTAPVLAKLREHAQEDFKSLAGQVGTLGQRVALERMWQQSRAAQQLAGEAVCACSSAAA